jgi:hypothetical protein
MNGSRIPYLNSSQEPEMTFARSCLIWIKYDLARALMSSDMCPAAKSSGDMLGLCRMTQKFATEAWRSLDQLFAASRARFEEERDRASAFGRRLSSGSNFPIRLTRPGTCCGYLARAGPLHLADG